MTKKTEFGLTKPIGKRAATELLDLLEDLDDQAALKLVNFKLSQESIDELEQAAKLFNSTKTFVVRMGISLMLDLAKRVTS